MSDSVAFFRAVAAEHPRCFWLDGGGAREWSGRRSIIGWLSDTIQHGGSVDLPLLGTIPIPGARTFIPQSLEDPGIDRRPGGGATMEDLARLLTGQTDLQKQQLDEQKKTNRKLQETGLVGTGE